MRTVVVINLLCYILTSVICVAILNAAITNINIVNKRTNNLSVWASIQDYGVFFPVSSGNDQDAIRRGEYPLDIPGYEFFKYANLTREQSMQHRCCLQNKMINLMRIS